MGSIYLNTNLLSMQDNVYCLTKASSKKGELYLNKYVKYIL